MLRPLLSAPTSWAPRFGRLHDPRTAAGHDHETPAFARLELAGGRYQAAEGAGLVIGALLVEHAAGPARRRCRVIRRCRQTRAAEHHDGRFDGMLGEQQLRLPQLELEPHRPQFVAQQEVGIGEGQAVGRRAGLRRVGLVRGPAQVLVSMRQRGIVIVRRRAQARPPRAWPSGQGAPSYQAPRRSSGLRGRRPAARAPSRVAGDAGAHQFTCERKTC
jgi:hypothetical protein